MALRIITAEERMREQAGVKAVILGPAKIGKTTLLRTLDAPRTLVLNIEAGDLAVRDVPYQELRPEGDAQWSWDELRDVAAYLGGPNPSRVKPQAYCPEHYGHASEILGAGIKLDAFDTLFVDSITVASRICMSWCQTQPRAFSEKNGKPDIRGAYGLLKEEMVGWITQLQHARGKNVIFLGLLDEDKDDFGRPKWSAQMEGQATANALLGIVDQVLTMQNVTFPSDGGDPGAPVRCFITQQGNPWGYPAGDRSGKLDPVEPPHLGQLIAKCASSSIQRAGIVTTMPEPTPATQAA